jgi:hypothetical protein
MTETSLAPPLLAAALVIAAVPGAARTAEEAAPPDYARTFLMNAECARTFDLRKAVAAGFEPTDQIEVYYACKAVAGDSAAPCSELAAAPKSGGIDHQARCRGIYHQALFVKAVLGGAEDEARRHCDEVLASLAVLPGQKRVPPEKISRIRRRFCDAAVAGDMEGVCRALGAADIAPLKCVEAARRCLLGDGEYRPPEARHINEEAGPTEAGCEWPVGYRRARASGDAEDCGDSSVCRALMKQGVETACGPDLEALRDQYCVRLSSKAR